MRIDANGVILSGTLTASLTDVNIEGGQDTTTNWSGSLAGQITGVNGLNLLPPGGTGKTFTLTLANTSTTSLNNYQGNTTVNAGNVLLLGATGQVPNGPGTGNMSLSGTFNLGGFNATVNGLSGAGTVDGASARRRSRSAATTRRPRSAASSGTRPGAWLSPKSARARSRSAVRTPTRAGRPSMPAHCSSPAQPRCPAAAR